jgi:AraC-like DNA-binding protein
MRATGGLSDAAEAHRWRQDLRLDPRERSDAAVRTFASLIARHAPEDGFFETALVGVKLIRWSVPTEPMPVIYEPTVCMVAQGRKQACLGDMSFVYDNARHLIASVDLPVAGSVIEASTDKPYLCMQIDLSSADLAELVLSAPAKPGRQPPTASAGLTVDDTTPELLDAATRLVATLDNADDVETLGPLILREIRYRLLQGPSGAIIRNMIRRDSRLAQIGRAILWLRGNFRSVCRIGDAADVAGMSRSKFHQHFRSITGLSPIEFRTQLRLQEARRLMVFEAHDAASAGFAVGYESPSQFSREYVRVFNDTPANDAHQRREALALMVPRPVRSTPRLKPALDDRISRSRSPIASHFA